MLRHDNLTGRRRLPRSCRQHVLRYHDRCRLPRLCRRDVLRHDDLAGTFLPPWFYRCRMLGYDDLACFAWPCWCDVFGYHGLTRMFRLCRRHVLRHDNLF